MQALPNIASLISAPAEVAVFNPFARMGGGGNLYIIKKL
jgi:hypothetical protein